MDIQTDPSEGELVYDTDKNMHTEHATHRTRHALSNTSSFTLVDLELNKRLTDVMAEKHTENKSHGSFSIMVSTGWLILCSTTDSIRETYACDLRFKTSATCLNADPTFTSPDE